MPLTPGQKNQISQRFNRGILTRQHLETYVQNGTINAPEEFEGINPEIVKLLREIIGNKPNPQEKNEWEALTPLLNTPGEELKLRLQMYVRNWSQSLPPGNHVDEAQQALANLDREIEDLDWQKIDLLNIRSLYGHLDNYPNSAHRNEIDDNIWSLISGNINAPDLLLKVEEYKNRFINGLHVPEANALVRELEEWETIRNANQLTDLHLFIQQHPDSRFLNDARLLLLRLKQEEIEDMKEKFNEYDRERLLYLLREGIFSRNELINNGVVTDYSLAILEKYEEIKGSLPDLDDVIPRCEALCYENHTDIYMFGIPSTGKSCVLAGVVSAHGSPLSYNAVRSGGRYADALVQFTESGFPPPPTRLNYLTTIEATVTDARAVRHDVNLVEMAGEEFAFHIADNPDNVVSLEDMGTGVTEILSNNNRKVFFIVVDPTKRNIRFRKAFLTTGVNGEIETEMRLITVNQKQCLKRMVDMLGLPENAKIMKNVDAIHFIMTKADTLNCQPHERDQKAVEFFTKEYQDVLRSLVEICHDYGINLPTDGFPKLYTFSLGDFYVGNIVDFNDQDSLKIIQAILSNTGGFKKKSWGEKIKDLFN